VVETEVTLNLGESRRYSASSELSALMPYSREFVICIPVQSLQAQWCQPY
jgi:hypothetical protein